MARSMRPRASSERAFESKISTPPCAFEGTDAVTSNSSANSRRKRIYCVIAISLRLGFPRRQTAFSNALGQPANPGNNHKCESKNKQRDQPIVFDQEYGAILNAIELAVVVSLGSDKKGIKTAVARNRYAAIYRALALRRSE